MFRGRSVQNSEGIREKISQVWLSVPVPRVHEATFHKAAEAKAGLNPYMWRSQTSVSTVPGSTGCRRLRREAVILAEQCSKGKFKRPLQPEKARLQESPDHRRRYRRESRRLLILPMQAMKLILWKKTPSIGGRMLQLDKTLLWIAPLYPHLKMVEAAAHEKINIYTCSEVEKVAGFVGDFTVDIRKSAKCQHGQMYRLWSLARKVSFQKIQMSSAEG